MKSKDLALSMALSMSALGGINPAYDMPKFGGSGGSHSKTYTNKNANIEYYLDEKGHIRRRKLKK